MVLLQNPCLGEKAHVRVHGIIFIKLPQKVILSRFNFIYKKKEMKCILCQVSVSNEDGFKKCETAQCLGTFCFDCYSSLKYCIICTHPAEYGDQTDLSEEKQVENNYFYIITPIKSDFQTPLNLILFRLRKIKKIFLNRK